VAEDDGEDVGDDEIGLGGEEDAGAGVDRVAEFEEASESFSGPT